MNSQKSKKNWIAGAIQHPGALLHAAQHAHLVSGQKPLTGADLAKLAKSKSPVTRKRVALARTLRKIGK